MKALEPRRREWDFQLRHPDGLLAPLGEVDDYWRPVSDLPGLGTFMQAATGSYRAYIAAYGLTSELLPSVVQAAEAAEYTVERIDAIAAEVRAWIDEHGLKADPNVPTNVGHPALFNLYVEVQNLQIWTRTIDERLDHFWEGTHYGLVPSLRDPSPLRTCVKRLHRSFVKGARESRYLANLGLHGAGLPYSRGNVAKLDESGLRVYFPDPVKSRVNHPVELTYKTGRDAIEAAHELLDVVYALVEGLLTAFHETAPERLRVTT